MSFEGVIDDSRSSGGRVRGIDSSRRENIDIDSGSFFGWRRRKGIDAHSTTSPAHGSSGFGRRHGMFVWWVGEAVEREGGVFPE